MERNLLNECPDDERYGGVTKLHLYTLPSLAHLYIHINTYPGGRLWGYRDTHQIHYPLLGWIHSYLT